MNGERHIDSDQVPFATGDQGPTVEKTDMPATVPTDAVASADLLAKASPNWSETKFAEAPDYHGVVRRMIERSAE